MVDELKRLLPAAEYWIGNQPHANIVRATAIEERLFVCPAMYWPLGVASVFQIPKEEGELLDEKNYAETHPLISLSRSSSGNMLATITDTELYLWQTQVHPPACFLF